MSAPKDPERYEEWRRKISKAKKGQPGTFAGRTHSEATKAKLRDARAKQVITDETRAKLSEKGRGKVVSEKTRAKMSEAQKGKPRWTEEDKAKMSAERKGRKPTGETRAKLKGRKLSEETKAKMSTSRKGHAVSAKTRAKIGAKHKGKRASEKTLKKMSDARKGIPNPKLQGYKHSEEFRAKATTNNLIRWQNASEDQRRAHLDKLHAGAKDIINSWIEDCYAQQLDAQGISYERQKRIGWYCVDFYIAATNTIIEVNGCFWHACEQCGNTKRIDMREKDAKRYGYLRKKGYTVIIVWEHELPRKPWTKPKEQS